MPGHTPSSLLEGLLTGKFGSRRVQGHHLSFALLSSVRYNTHTKCSDPLVYENFGVKKYSGFTVAALKT